MNPEPLKPSLESVSRGARVERRTRETEVEATLVLDGRGEVQVETGIGFLDHMITALAFHARFDLSLRTRGDLHVDDHHTVEDTALVIGEALDEALGDRRGIARFADATVPLDESLARASVDLVRRPHCEVLLGLQRERLGTLACENVEHFVRSLVSRGQFTLHLDVLRGTNDHHRAEAAFKALARALRSAIRLEDDGEPSTKGSMT